MPSAIKKKIHGHGQTEETEVNMTPMLDIVFIMLIFFIVTAVFVKIPAALVETSEAKNTKDVRRIALLLALDREGKIWIDKDHVSLENLRITAEKMKRENPKGQIVLRADNNSNAGDVVKIVEALNQVGITHTVIASRRDD